MSLTYGLRLTCLCLAVFFLIHIAAGLALSLLTPALIRLASRIRSNQAALLLFAARLVPAVCGLWAVTLICVPAYLLFEPAGAEEEVGSLCIAGSLLCILCWCWSLFRTARAWLYSVNRLQQCRKEGRQAQGLLVVEDDSAGLALVGLFRPQMVISAALKKALEPDELTAALLHESAHCHSRDNLKRLLLLLTPGMLPGLNGLKRLEQAWARFAEWAADDRAVNGDPLLSLSLAAALVRVARLGMGPVRPHLISTLLGADCDLVERVNRLMDPPAPVTFSRRLTVIGSVLLAAVSLGVPTAATTGMLNHLYGWLEACLH